jgi:putative PIN family toxin of toxin-antitoxin system
MIRVVLDTSVLVSAVISPHGPNAEVFDLIAGDRIVPCISAQVVDEYYRVFSYQRLQHLDRDRITKLLSLIEAVSRTVRPKRRLTVSSHGDDNRIYECAAAANAHYIVTENTRHFKEPYKTTRIVNARQLLKLLGSGAEDE